MYRNPLPPDFRGVARADYARYRDCALLIDSRRVVDPARTVFCAFAGRRTDGHAYLEELRHRGVRYFVVSDAAAARRAGLSEAAGCTVHRTDDVAGWMLGLAAHRRADFGGHVVGITGSNGKTTVKDWLVHLLRPGYQVCASPRSFNSRIGVALSVWQLRPDDEVGIFELGISQAGDAARLAGVVRPDLGVFTYAGSAHDAGFADRAAKIREKLNLLAGSRLLLPDDGAILAELRPAERAAATVWSAHDPTADPLPDRGGPAAGPAARYNATLTNATYRALLGPAAPPPRWRPDELPPLDNRLEQRSGRAGGTVINDSYSNDFDALAAALAFAEQQDAFGRITLVLGTIQESDQLPQRLAGLLKDRVDELITVGQAAREVAAGVAAEHVHRRHYADPAALLAAAGTLDLAGRTILVKGSHDQHLGQFVEAVSLSRHRTVLETDLTAIRHNYRAYAGRLPPTVGKIVMVKASAYGGGLLPVARALAAEGADYFAVAYPEEGRELRDGGIERPVLVLNAEAHAYDLCRRHRLEPVVHDLAGLDRAARLGLAVHLELDTGMGRLGFRPEQVGALANRLRALGPAVRVASVFSHLAASETPGLDGFTRQQAEAFAAAYRNIAPALPAPPPRHLLNSNGVSRFPEYAHEFVRLGIGLFGIGDRTLGRELRVAGRLVTQVTGLSERPAGATVGYGRRGRLGRPSRIAVLSIGYADGLPRLAGEGRYAVLIGGRPAPLVGAVCMDMCMADVTDLPGVGVGSRAVVFGPEHPIAALATAARTIPYEILTGVGPRVHRVYLGE